MLQHTFSWLLWAHGLSWIPGTALAGPESCNTIDDDGDGSADEGPVAWYVDGDGDGMGDPALIVWGLDCANPPPSTVPNPGDCNDARPESRLGLLESSTPDGFDDDCDGTVDEGAIPINLSCDSNSVLFSDADSTFLLCNEERTWSVARQRCQEQGYYLATIDDEDENYEIWLRLPPVPGFFNVWDYWWMGLHEENAQNNWVWETGPASLLLWDGSQPNDVGLDCGLQNGVDSLWYDDTCTLTYPFICEANCIQREAFLDSDGDGLGAPGTAVLSCTLPPGHAWNDEDCNDENFALTRPIWFVDADADGFGSGELAGFDCVQPPMTSAFPTDCDDTNAHVRPGLQEVCDAAQVDEDCNGFADDQDPDIDPAVQQIYFLDQDQDGYGAGEPISACHPPPGAVSADGDCDDADGGRFPGNEEIPGDNIDQNCDLQDTLVEGTETSTDPLGEDNLPPGTDKDAYPDAVGCACSTPPRSGARPWTALPWALGALAVTLIRARIQDQVRRAGVGRANSRRAH